MRILLAGPLNAPFGVEREINSYRAAAHDVTVNAIFFDEETLVGLQQHYADDDRVIFCTFDPASPEDLSEELTRGMLGYEAVSYPPDLEGFTDAALLAAASADLAHPLRAVGCPNDVVRHLALVQAHGVKVFNASDIHATAVGEYTLGQIACHARRFGHFYRATGAAGAWPHDEAVTSTYSLRGKTIGIIGVTGKDGRAVAVCSQQLGLRVLGLGRDGSKSHDTIQGMGIEPVSTLEDLVTQSDFISINSKKDASLGLIGQAEIAKMKRGVIVINPAGAEIIDKHALFEEFSRTPRERTIGALVLDMPYGGRRGASTFARDADNARLRELGVLFTPRMAGYTIDTYIRGVEQVADDINRYLAQLQPAHAIDVNLTTMTIDLLKLAKAAGAKAIELRRAGLTVHTKPDGTPCTNADIAAEQTIRDGLRKRYQVTIVGEELGTDVAPNAVLEAIIDGIDGTRNFRDGNYGWCTSVCVKRKGESVIGVVHDAKCRETYWAVKGQGAFHNDGIVTKNLKVPAELARDFSFSVGSFRLAGSTEIKNQLVADIKSMGGRQREWGSVALSICQTAIGGLGAFIQGNATSHDYAAGLVIAEEAGAIVTRLPSHESGKQDIIVAHPSVSGRLLAIYAKRVKFNHVENTDSDK
jgi:myo-inositol-1(or 4)-monophosphatase